VPSGIGHPDGSLRIQKASAKQTAAYRDYMEALQRSGKPAPAPSDDVKPEE
jgi:hypothetical protein